VVLTQQAVIGIEIVFYLKVSSQFHISRALVAGFLMKLLNVAHAHMGPLSLCQV
jgi:hypothetical protein